MITRLVVDRPITHNQGGGISADAVAAMLVRATAHRSRSILIAIDSEGGNVEQALAMYDHLRRFARTAGRVVAYTSRAWSAAALLALAADYGVIAPGAEIMTHSPSGGDESAREMARRRLVEVYCDRTFDAPAALAYLLQPLTGDTFIRPRTAIAHGWADEWAVYEFAERQALQTCARMAELARRIHCPAKHLFRGEAPVWS